MGSQLVGELVVDMVSFEKIDTVFITVADSILVDHRLMSLLKMDKIMDRFGVD